MEIIHKYFTALTNDQLAAFGKLHSLYSEWNAQINVISRKDIDELYERHVLHSLAIARFIKFTPGTKILDVGTGGGFPGIPLAIFFPEVNFHLVDSIGKKIKVVKAVAESLNLKNVKAEQIRAEELKGHYDFIVSRAVTQLPVFLQWVKKNVSEKQKNAVSNGVFLLKGGNLDSEIHPYKKKIFVQEISDLFDEEFFKTKKLLYLPVP
ncbi:MAG TPA: 16S rRNA (guanine(527)-N(7))-methyltransferase RsmG [Mariniphaga sp.]|nr:16S rRNA (guanine(527)-N(7))-methyltransferase RsmG [Mariniphaga sp.]